MASIVWDRELAEVYDQTYRAGTGGAGVTEARSRACATPHRGNELTGIPAGR